MTPLRIAVVAACGYPTNQGSQVYIRATARAMAERGHDVRVLAYDYGEDGVSTGGVPIRRIPGVPGYRKLRAGPSRTKPRLDAQLARLVSRTVRDERIDVVHVHNVEAPFAALPTRLRSGVPVVGHVHTLLEEELPTFLPSTWAPASAFLGRTIDCLLPRAVDALVVLSARAGVCLRGMGVESERIFHVPPAIDPRDFGEPSPPGAKPVVVYAGNPDLYQEPTTLLRAFAIVFRERPDAVLRLVSGASMQSWVARASRLGIPAEALETIRADSWSATREAMRGACVGVVPRSICAGFPIKLLNYMASGLPVVACRGASGPIRDGLDGFVVPPTDSVGFGAALLRVLNDPAAAHRMGRSARTSVLEGHTWADRVGSFDRVHRAVGADRGPSPARRRLLRVRSSGR